MTEPTIFVSYSHKDEEEKNRLLTHVGVLRTVEVWSDDRIGGGGDWRQEIDDAMSQATVALLLITANFLTSRFIGEKEVPRLLERRQHDGLTVIPVIARACAWQRVPWLSAMNVRPKNGRPVWGDGGSHVDEDLATIAIEVDDVIKRAQAAQAPPEIQLQTETNIQPPPPTNGPTRTPNPPPARAVTDRRQLRRNLVEHFSEDDIRSMVFDLEGVDWDNLSGGNKGAKVIALIQFMENRGRYAELVAAARRDRDHLEW